MGWTLCRRSKSSSLFYLQEDAKNRKLVKKKKDFTVDTSRYKVFAFI